MISFVRPITTPVSAALRPAASRPGSSPLDSFPESSQTPVLLSIWKLHPVSETTNERCYLEFVWRRMKFTFLMVLILLSFSGSPVSATCTLVVLTMFVPLVSGWHTSSPSSSCLRVLRFSRFLRCFKAAFDGPPPT